MVDVTSYLKWGDLRLDIPKSGMDWEWKVYDSRLLRVVPFAVSAYVASLSSALGHTPAIYTYRAEGASPQAAMDNLRHQLDHERRVLTKVLDEASS